MDPYDQYMADIAYEDYLSQVEQEDAVSRGASSNFLGPDYEASVGSNVLKGVTDFPAATIEGVKATHKFLNPVADYGRGGPVDTISRDIEQTGGLNTAKTVGSIGAGTAAALKLGALGGKLGAIGGPWGAALGGGLGGLIGFGAGMTGFDVLSDTVTGDVQDAGNYIKDFGYNTGQNLIPGLAAPAAGKLARSATRRFTKGGAQDTAAQALDDISPGYADKVDDAIKTNEAFPDPFFEQKSLAEIVDDPALKAYERTLVRTGPEAYGKGAQRYQARKDAQLSYLDDIESSDYIIDDAQDAIRKVLDDDVVGAQSRVSTAQQSADDAFAALPENIDTSEAGSIIRGQAQANLDDSLGKVRQAFDAAGDAELPLGDSLAQLNDVVEQYFPKNAGPRPTEITSLLKRLKGEAGSKLVDAQGAPIAPTKFTIREIQKIRSDALKTAQGSDPRVNAVAGRIVQALDDVENNAVKLGAIDADNLAALEQGRSLRKEVGDIFEDTSVPTKAALRKQRYNRYALPESAVPGKFFIKGNKGAKESIRNYKRAVGSSPEALEPLYRHAATSFKDYVLKDGKINTAKASRWIKEHGDALKELPELRSQLKNVDEAQALLEREFGSLARTQKEIESGALKFFLDADPDQAISKMLQGKNRVKKTISTVNFLKSKDPDALAGLRRGVIDYVKNEPTIFNTREVTGGAVSKWSQLRPALEKSKLFTKSQMKAFDWLYKDKVSQASIEKAKPYSGSDTAGNLSSLAALSKLNTRAFLRRKFAGSKYFGQISTVIEAIPQSKFNAAIEEALLNPRYARDLMLKATNKNLTRNAERLFGVEISEALKSRGVLSNTKDTVKVGATFAPNVINQPKLTAEQTFPDTQELLNPPEDTKKKSDKEVQPVKLSSSGQGVIKEAEGLELEAYQDTGGVWTIGYGHTGPEARPGARISEEEANELLARDVQEAENIINKHVKVPLSQNQFDALASFAYNVGEGQFMNSTLLRKLNDGQYSSVPVELDRWVYDNGQVVKGLINRREKEKKLFLA